MKEKKERKFTDEEVRLIRAKLVIGVKPSFIVDELNNTPRKTPRKTPVNKMDISNIGRRVYYKNVI